MYLLLYLLVAVGIARLFGDTAGIIFLVVTLGKWLILDEIVAAVAPFRRIHRAPRTRSREQPKDAAFERGVERFREIDRKLVAQAEKREALREEQGAKLPPTTGYSAVAPDKTRRRELKNEAKNRSQGNEKRRPDL